MSKSVCYTPNPLIRDGMSGKQRKLAPLDPSWFKVDERKTSDLLVFASRFAAQLNYFNSKNKVEGDWTQFILNDISTRIALITIHDPDEDKEGWETQLEVLLTNYDQPSLEMAMGYTLGLASMIQEWKLQVKGSNRFYSEISNLIRSGLSRPFKQLLAWSKGTPFGDLGFTYTEFDEDWIATGEIIDPDSSIFTGANNQEKIESASSRLKLNFRAFHETVIRIVASADAYLQETLGTWPDHKPHQALFIGFLLLFRHAQAHINTLTQRHLDFYYREVLRLAPLPPVPDQVHLIFELAKNTTSHQLISKTRFKAGKDSESKERFYALNKNFVINTASVKELKSVFSQAENYYKTWAAPIANSSDGQGGTYADGEEKRWEGLGNNEQPEAAMGMVFASPVLLLREGIRKVTLTWNFNADSFDAAKQNMADINEEKQGCDASSLLTDTEKEFLIYFTTEKEWTQVAAEYITSITLIESTRKLVVDMLLPEEYPSIVELNAKVHTEGFATTWPAVKLLLNNDKMPFTYGKLRNVQVETIDARVEVTGVKTLVVQSDYSVQDASKNYQPFGPSPTFGSSFFIGNQEVFSKQLSSLTVAINWAGLPEGAFKDYYKYYTGLKDNNSLSLIKVRLDILDQRKWKPLVCPNGNAIHYAMLQSFNCATTTLASNYPEKTTTLQLNQVKVMNGALQTAVPRNEKLEPFVDYNTMSTKGFIRLQLQKDSSGAGLDFGHKQYTNLVAVQTLKVAKEAMAGGTITESLPNLPYTPEVSGVSLNYVSQVTLDLKPREEAGAATGAVSFAKRVEQYFHISPFGQEEVHPQVYEPWSNPDQQGTGVCMALPVIEGEGQLYIGLTNFQPEISNSLSVLFQVSEGSGNPDLLKPDLVWSYLTGNRWKQLRTDEVTGDTTNGLLTSGIVSFTIPREADNTSTLFTGGLHWLRVHAPERTEALPDFLEVLAQASTATFQDSDNADDHLASALPASTISNMEVKDAEIKKVSQPYASFGGKVRETDPAFYTRVSERLRHKDRAINIWDYEALVLNQFPQVYKVKCLNHSNKRTGLAPGCVYLVVIPSQENRNSDNPLEPRASVNTLDEISKFILKRVSPFVKLEVRNPTYEQIRVEFNVKFRKGEDEGFSLRLIQEDIRKYLSPWAFSDGQEISFEGKIHASVIVNFIEELSYVDYITDFKMFHVTADAETGTETIEAVVTTPMSILVSAYEHKVTLLGGTTS